MTTGAQPAILKLIQANKRQWSVSDKQFDEYLSCLQAYQARAAEIHPVSQRDYAHHLLLFYPLTSPSPDPPRSPTPDLRPSTPDP